jgi:hypothetical protein
MIDDGRESGYGISASNNVMTPRINNLEQKRGLQQGLQVEASARAEAAQRKRSPGGPC